MSEKPGSRGGFGGLQNLDAGHVQQGTNDNAVGIRIDDHQSGAAQGGATGIADGMNGAAGKVYDKRLKGPGIQQLAKIVVIHDAKPTVRVPTSVINNPSVS